MEHIYTHKEPRLEFLLEDDNFNKERCRTAYYVQRHEHTEFKEVEVINVLIHGFAHCAATLFPMGEAILLDSQNAHPVVSYDVYGRGSSGWDGSHQTVDLFVGQLSLLLTHLRHTKFPKLSRVNLLGFSMGGLISVTFASRHPEWINKMILLDAAGLPVHLPLVAKMVTMPVIGPLLVRTVGAQTTVNNTIRNFYRPNDPQVAAMIEDTKDMIRRQLAENTQYLQALGSTLMNTDMGGHEVAYKTVGNMDTNPRETNIFPVKIIWGEHDTVCPTENAYAAQRFIPRASLHIIPNSGHDAKREQADLVFPLVTEFFAPAAKETLRDRQVRLKSRL